VRTWDIFEIPLTYSLPLLDAVLVFAILTIRGPQNMEVFIDEQNNPTLFGLVFKDRNFS